MIKSMYRRSMWRCGKTDNHKFPNSKFQFPNKWIANFQFPNLKQATNYRNKEIVSNWDLSLWFLWKFAIYLELGNSLSFGACYLEICASFGNCLEIGTWKLELAISTLYANETTTKSRSRPLRRSRLFRHRCPPKKTRLRRCRHFYFLLERESERHCPR